MTKIIIKVSPAQSDQSLIEAIAIRGSHVRQVSHLTGIPASAVNTRMFYARNWIARQLGNCDLHRVSAEHVKIRRQVGRSNP